MDIYMYICSMKYYLQEYKGIWYMYDNILDRWILSDSPNYEASHLMMFRGSYLITECFKKFKEELWSTLKECI